MFIIRSHLRSTLWVPPGWRHRVGRVCRAMSFTSYGIMPADCGRGRATSGHALVVASFTPLLCGFSIGITCGNIGGVLQNSDFQRRYHNPDDLTLQLLAATMQIGSVVGSMFASWSADALGRRAAIMISMAVIVAGSAVLALPAVLPGGQLFPLFVGRLLNGLANGLGCTVVPLHVSETAPAHHRGAIESSFQLAIELGILVAYLINWGVGEWRNGWTLALAAPLPTGLLFLVVASMQLPESPRFLVARGRSAEAAAVLASSLRTPLDDVSAEVAAIEAAHDEHAQAVVSWTELLGRGVRRRVIVAIVVLTLQVGTGIDLVTVFAPRIFAAALGGANATGDGSGSGDLDPAQANPRANLYTILVGVVFCVVTPWTIVSIDRCGRRLLLLMGSALMTLSLMGLAVAFRQLEQGHAQAYGGTLPAMCVALVLTFVAAFSFSWGPVAWVIPSELIGSRLRAKVVALGTVMNWTADYAVVGSFLSLNHALGEAGSFALYALINLGAFVFVWLLVPETKGRQLEDVAEQPAAVAVCPVVREALCQTSEATNFTKLAE